MERNRLLELAVDELKRQKTGIVAEIEIIRSELEGTIKTAKNAKSALTKIGRNRPKTWAERKAQSQKMRKYWAEKKAGKTKSKAADQNPTAKIKVRTKTDEEKKALSKKMKEVWKKRKAAARKKL